MTRHPSRITSLLTIAYDELRGWSKPELAWLLFGIALITIVALLTNDSALGIVSAITGTIGVILAGKGKLTFYLINIVYLVTYLIISFRAGYYLTFVIELACILPMTLVGFILWLRHMNPDTHEVDKRRLSMKTLFLGAAVVAGLIVLSTFILQFTNDPQPLVDSATNMLLVTAFLLTILRYSEQWLVWIVVNALGTLLWLIDFLATGNNAALLAMWAFYLANSIIMCVKWYRATENPA